MSTISDRDMVVRRMTRSDIDTILTLDRKISQVRGKVSYRDLVVIEPSGPLDFSFVCEYQARSACFRSLRGVSHIWFLEPFGGFGLDDGAETIKVAVTSFL